MKPTTLDGVFEPDQWFVVFHRDAPNRWLSWLAMGEFKHVSAFAYCAGFKLWLIYDTELCGTRIKLMPHGDPAIARLTDYMRGCAIVTFSREFEMRHWSTTSRLGFYCVPAIKHLLGVHCGALRPDGLYRALLRKGGRPLNANLQPSTVAARPAVTV